MNKNKIIQEVLKGFQNNKGKGVIYCFDYKIIPELVYNVIVPFAKKHTGQILIVVDSYNTRASINKYLTDNNVTESTGYNIKILSKDYINLKYKYEYKLVLCIGVNDDTFIIHHLRVFSTFMLCILTKNIMNNAFITYVRKLLPDINIDGLSDVGKEDRIYSPVEEHRIGVELSDKDFDAYNKYTEYINTSVSIFGDLSNIEKCKKGDIKLGISSAEFRDTLARENGWSENLDTSVEYIRQIDDIYNPNNLFERACNFYNITKQRRDLVCDNNSKLAEIYRICSENKDKKILIISKRGEFAAKITKYLNDNEILCGDYHDCIDDSYMYDINGNIIVYKTGAKKGEPKLFGWQAQSSQNELLFNNGNINVLSIKNASNTKLLIACDIVIITSPLCDNIIDIKKRFASIEFNGLPNKVYKLFCNGTIENIKLSKEKENNIIKVINETENFIGYDENSGDIIL